MPFKKGQEKKGGRSKGTQNKISKELKENIETFLESNFQDFIETFSELEGETKVRHYLKLIEFVVPKKKELKQEITAFPDSVSFSFEKYNVKPIESESDAENQD